MVRGGFLLLYRLLIYLFTSLTTVFDDSYDSYDSTNLQGCSKKSCMVQSIHMSAFPGDPRAPVFVFLDYLGWRRLCLCCHGDTCGKGETANMVPHNDANAP